MLFDPKNHVIKLCAQGMNLEAAGKIEEAHQLFQQAWESGKNDRELFSAAHFLARNQKDPLAKLDWNLKSLELAKKIQDENVFSTLSSLYLNIGKSYEDLKDVDRANTNYLLALEYARYLKNNAYGEMIKSGISNGLKRTEATEYNDPVITALVFSWCEKKNLRALSYILPAYTTNLGTENDRNKMISALSYLSATGCLKIQGKKLLMITSFTFLKHRNEL